MSKSAKLYLIILASLFSLPAVAIAAIALYQSIRTFYCSCFYKNESSLSVIWCNLVSYDFRPDIIIIVLVVFLVYSVVFTLESKGCGLRFLGRRFLFWIFIGVLGFLMNWTLNSQLSDQSWW